MKVMQKDVKQSFELIAQELIRALEKILAQFQGKGDGPALPDLLSEMAAYAWKGETAATCEHWLDERVNELCTCDELLRGNFMSASGDELFPDNSRSLIKRLVEAVHARKAIDEGNEVTTEGLAALANVSERTIRAATNANSANPVPIVKKGHWTTIEAKHALAWLSRRNDFIATRNVLEKPDAGALTLFTEPGSMWKRWREFQGLTVDDLASRLDWTTTETAAYNAVEAGNGAKPDDLSPVFWAALAKQLGAEDAEAVAAQTYRLIATAYINARIRDALPRSC